MNQVVAIKHEQSNLIPMDGLVPSSMAEAIKLSELMATARLVPKDLQKSPADCLMVIQQAVRWRMDPFAVAQECSVIQGKLMHSGKLVAAVVNARGKLAERLSFTYAGEDQNRSITVSGRLAVEATARTVTVKLSDAKTNNGMWTKQPDQQLMYHGTRVWARRHTPELMLGVCSPEEFDEEDTPRAYGDAPYPPEVKPVPRKPPPPVKQNDHDPQTGEIGPRAIPLPQDVMGSAEVQWAHQFIAALKTATSVAEIDGWKNANADMIRRVREYAPQAYNFIIGTATTAKAKFSAPIDDDSAPAQDGIPDFLKRNGEPHVSAPSTSDPVVFREWVHKTMLEIADPHKLEDFFNDMIAPRMGDLFPPDQEEILALYRKHEARLAP